LEGQLRLSFSILCSAVYAVCDSKYFEQQQFFLFLIWTILFFGTAIGIEFFSSLFLFRFQHLKVFYFPVFPAG